MGGFNREKFEAESFRAREAEVEVPELAAFFDDGARAVFKIRSLTAGEVARVRDSVTRAKDVEGLVSRLAATSSRDKADAVLEVLGLAVGQESDDFIRRVTLLELGAVEPKLSRPVAIKVSEVAPLAFYRLTDEIYSLTGKGRLGESSGSGTSPESGQVCPSVPGADSAEGDSGSCTK